MTEEAAKEAGGSELVRAGTSPGYAIPPEIVLDRARCRECGTADSRIAELLGTPEAGRILTGVGRGVGGS
jgi:hypothetical protein